MSTSSTTGTKKNLPGPIDKWLAALRSGQYRQTQSWLRRSDGYCCLGVACELYRQEVGGFWSNASDFVVNRRSSNSHLPVEVAQWLGLIQQGGMYEGGSLVELNDNGKSFAEIADIIESKPKGLFK